MVVGELAELRPHFAAAIIASTGSTARNCPLSLSSMYGSIDSWNQRVSL